MAVLKQIKFGTGSATPIAMTQVAIETESQKALSVVGTNTGLDVNNDPVYTIGLAVDGKTITKTGDNGLATALALKVEAASGSGDDAKKARISLVDSNGGSGYAELSSVNIEDIVGDGIVESATYNTATGKLTITWAGSGDDKTTEIDLGALLDIQDIVIAEGSGDYLSFAAVSPAPGTDAGQAQIGVKLADVTFTAASGGNSANLTVDTGNGKMLDASDAIPAIKQYVDAQTTDLAVQAEGDNYITAAVDGQNNKKINVSADVQTLTATAGTPGTYGTDGSQTTAPTAGTLSGTANSLADGADIATKVKTYVDGAIAIEAARSDAKNKADIAVLDVTDAAVDGQYVSSVSETDGKIAVSRLNVSDAVLNGYAKGTDATAIAATDSLKAALSKLENQVDKAKAAATTKVVEGTDAGNNMEITSATSETDGSTTYTINLTDVASKAALDAEIAARKAVDGQSGQTYAANSGTNYISDANSLNNADVKLDAALKAEETRAESAETAIDTAVGLTKAASGETRTWAATTNYGGTTTSVKDNMQALDTQLKAVSDKLDGVQYKVNGTTLEFYGISEKTGA